MDNLPITTEICRLKTWFDLMDYDRRCDLYGIPRPQHYMLEMYTSNPHVWPEPTYEEEMRVLNMEVPE